MDAFEIIYEHYITPFQNKSQRKRLVGLELEFPVRCRQGTDNLGKPDELRSILGRFTDKGFSAEEFSADGYCIRAGNQEGTAISFDSSYLNFECSLAPSESLSRAYPVYVSCFNQVQECYRQMGYEMYGRALNYYAIEAADSRPILRCHNDPCYMEYQFLKLYQKENHPVFLSHPSLFTIVSSVQTHFDCGMNELPRYLNVMNRLDFINHLLFDNSLFCFYGTWYLGGRYFLYRKSGFTRLGLSGGTDEAYSCVDDIVRDYARHKLAFRLREGEPEFFLPVSLEEYYHTPGRKPERGDIRQVYSYKNTELSRFGTIEHRMMDTQPLCDVFMPSAWMCGLLNRLDETEEELNRIGRDVFPGYSNTLLGDMAICADFKPFFLQMGMEERAARLYEISLKGLSRADKAFLLGLEGRIGGLKSPADRELNRLKRCRGRADTKEE